MNNAINYHDFPALIEALAKQGYEFDDYDWMFYPKGNKDINKAIDPEQIWRSALVKLGYSNKKWAKVKEQDAVIYIK